MSINEIVQTLLQLQGLDFSEVKEAGAEGKRKDLRAQIPAPILDHYDRLRVRGKKGVTAVRHQVCTGCHMLIPRAEVISLMHGNDIQICENCGRYLYLAEEPKEPVATDIQPAQETDSVRPKSPGKKRSRSPRKLPQSLVVTA